MIRLTDIPYGTGAETLDFYDDSPSVPRKRLIVHFHGGSFQAGDKWIDETMSPWSWLLRSGAAVASCNYPLAAGGFYWSQQASVLHAVAFFKAQYARFQITPEEIVVYGSSAGCVLAQLAILSALPADQPRAMILEKGLSDWTKAATAGTFFGKPLAQVPLADLQAGSATYLIQRGAPLIPTFGLTDETLLPVGTPPITPPHDPYWTIALMDALESVGAVKCEAFYRGMPNLDPAFLLGWMDEASR